MPPCCRSVLLFLTTAGLLAIVLGLAGSPATEPADKRIPALQSAGPRYWKGNLHTHSLWSDGDDFPEMIASWYKDHQYQFLALTDHNVLADGERWIDVTVPKTEKSKGRDVSQALEKYRGHFGDAWVERRSKDGMAQVRLKPLAEYRSMLEEPGRFLLLPAEEITHSYAKAPVHMNAINLRDVIKPVDGASIAETVLVNYRRVEEQSRKTGWRMIAFLNHPNFGWGIRAEDMILTEELRFFEVYNGHPGVRNYGDATHPSCERLWDILLTLRMAKHRLPIVYGLATDDAHGYHAFGVGKVNPGRGWVMVRANYLSAEAIVRAMQAGDFYCSTGVTLQEIRSSGDQLKIVIQSEPGVKYQTQFLATMRDVSLDSEPRRDADGKLLDVTRVYSDDIGKVIAEVPGTEATYRFTGRELYVRAKIVSSKPHPNPYQAGDKEVAWTQPFAPTAGPR